MIVWLTPASSHLVTLTDGTTDHRCMYDLSYRNTVNKIIENPFTII